MATLVHQSSTNGSTGNDAPPPPGSEDNLKFLATLGVEQVSTIRSMHNDMYTSCSQNMHTLQINHDKAIHRLYNVLKTFYINYHCFLMSR